MLKSFKYLILGVGIGLIAASYFVQDVKAPAAVKDDTGFVVPAGAVRSEAEPEDVAGHKDNGMQIESGHAEDANPESTEDAARPGAPGEAESIPEKETDSYTTISIIIPRGTSSYSVGRILHKNGLIDDVMEFEKRIIELGLDKKLKAGEHKINGGAPMDEIIYAITKTTPE